jgi:hypothetical protein
MSTNVVSTLVLTEELAMILSTILYVPVNLDLVEKIVQFKLMSVPEILVCIKEFV